MQEGYEPVAHIEMDHAACNTLRTRTAFHHLEKTPEGRRLYCDYLLGKITRSELYASVPKELLESVIEGEISGNTIGSMFETIDRLLQGCKVDLVVGGPPCQAYSLIGRAATQNGMTTDPRNYLFQYYVQFLERYKPKFFVFENVLGILSAKDQKGGLFYEQILKAFDEAGYRVSQHIIKTEEYGLPQRRRRVILLGCSGDLQLNEGLDLSCVPQSPTIRELFADLKPLQAGTGCIRANGRKRRARPCQWLLDNGIADYEYPVTYQQSRPLNEHDSLIYAAAVQLWNQFRVRFNYAEDVPDELKTHKNRTAFLDRFKVVDGDATASHTLVAHLHKDGHYYIHFDINQNRSITPREAARLQTFPDNYFFESGTEKDGRGAAYRQIGNAVPVLLAKLIAKSLKTRF